MNVLDRVNFEEVHKKNTPVLPVSSSSGDDLSDFDFKQKHIHKIETAGKSINDTISDTNSSLISDNALYLDMKMCKKPPIPPIMDLEELEMWDEDW